MDENYRATTLDILEDALEYSSTFVALGMKNGTIAKPSVDQLIEIYGVDALITGIATFPGSVPQEIG